MKSFKEYLTEKTIYDYLIWEPEGIFKDMADQIVTIESSPDLVYRGLSGKELETLMSKGLVTSKGEGNTSDLPGTYVSDDVQLAGRFALVAYRDTGKGILMAIRKEGLSNLTPRDKGNYITDYIPKENVEWVYTLDDSGINKIKES